MRISAWLLSLMVFSCHTIASEHPLQDSDRCEATPKENAFAVAKEIGPDREVVKSGDVYLIVKPDTESSVVRTEAGKLAKRNVLCKALCNDHVVEGCGVLLACADWALSDFQNDAPMCSTIWFVTSSRLKNTCGCF